MSAQVFASGDIGDGRHSLPIVFRILFLSLASSPAIFVSRVDARDEEPERFGLKCDVFEKRPLGCRPGTEKEHGAKGAASERPAKRYGRFLTDFVLLGGVQSLCFSHHGVYKADYVSEREPSYLSTCPEESAR